MSYATAKVIPFKPVKQKEQALSIVPNSAYQVSKIDLVFVQKGIIKDRPCVKSSHDAYDIFKSVWDDNHIDMVEEFKVAYLNRSNYVLSIFELSRGGITGTVADPRHIITAGLQQNSVSMILAHNHPSGGLKASKADEDLTQKISHAAKFFDMKVLDHVIMSREGYYSFADEGLCL